MEVSCYSRTGFETKNMCLLQMQITYVQTNLLQCKLSWQ